MLAKDGFIELHHFDAGYFKTFALEAAEDVAYETTRYGGWFEDDKSLLHGELVKAC